jgi:hypothetical protein
MENRYQMFNGLQFREEYPGGYYIHNSVGSNIRMHRYVWEYYYGKIPKGYEIHHIDGNRGNNDISNLRILTTKEHRKYHSDNLSDEERHRRRDNMLKNAIPAATEWHKSESGKNWHSQPIKQQHENGCFIQNLTCTMCGKEYTGKRSAKNGNTFCSDACKAKYLRLQRSKDKSDNRVCVICGTVFECSKWSKSQTCSKQCANKLSWRRRSESKIGEKN